jgi:hypothetical protein
LPFLTLAGEAANIHEVFSLNRLAAYTFEDTANSRPLASK